MKKPVISALLSLFSLGIFAQIPTYVPANGLVGWWPFNGNTNDESGNGNHGTVNGATLTNDRFGNANKAYSFNGNNFISVPHNSTFNMSQATWNVWVTKNSASLGNGMYIFGKRDNAQHHITFNEYLGNGNGSIGWAAGQATGGGGGSIVGGWHMLTIVYNQSIFSNNFVYYFDGIQTGTTTVNSFTFLNGDVRFGIEVNNPYWQGFNGFIDDALVYNRILSNCEIQGLYNAQLGSQAISAGTDQTICTGDNLTLNGSGGSAYQWNNNVVNGASFAPTQTAAYTVSGTDSLGCSGSDTVVVTVLENAVSTLTQTALDSYTLNGQTYTQSGTYTQTVPAANGCDSTITLNLTLNFTGINELGTSAKKLVKITDLNGKIIPRRKNTIMLFIYEDGTVERVVEMD
jgi:hypothetical protein